MLPLIRSSTPRSRPFHVNTPYASPDRPLARVLILVNRQYVSGYTVGRARQLALVNARPIPRPSSALESSNKFGFGRVAPRSTSARETARAALSIASRIVRRVTPVV